MRKKELIAIHQLLHLFVERADENSERDADQMFDLEEYRELGVSPQGIHQTKNDQEEAILKLAEKLGKGIEEYGDEVSIIETETEEVSMDQMKDTHRRAHEMANQVSGLEDESESSDNDKANDGQDDASDVGDSGADWSKL